MTVTPIQLLRSSTANKRPVPEDLSSGQPAVNTNSADPGLYFRDTSDNLFKIGPCSVGSQAPNSNPPTGGSSGNGKGEFWFDTTIDTLKVWDGTTWKDCSGNGPAVTTFSYTTSSLNSGDALNFELGIGKLYQVLTIEMSRPAWLRVYGNSSGRNDDDRTEPGPVYPAPGSGFFAEVVTTPTNLSVFMSPIPSVQQASNQTFFRIVNQDDEAGTIEVTLTVAVLIF